MIDRYLLTISCHQHKCYVDKQSLDEVIRWLADSIPSLKIVVSSYEIGKEYRQLHWHSTVTVDKYFRYSPYISYGDLQYTYKTFKIKWVKQYNDRAISYVLKDTGNCPILQDQILMENKYSHEYAF